MGWCNDSFPGHEGYVVAFVERTMRVANDRRNDEVGSGVWRELGYPDDSAPGVLDVRRIAVACDCGWRSPTLYAPHNGATYRPFSVTLTSERDEERAREIWRAHCHSLSGLRRIDAFTLFELAERVGEDHFAEGPRRNERTHTRKGRS
jgi:hypothetical protein